MWGREDLCGQGFGRQLLEKAETEARQRGAKHVYLNTFSFQAPAFYEKSGYAEFGRWKISRQAIPAISWSKRFRAYQVMPLPGSQSPDPANRLENASVARTTQTRIMMAPTTQFFGFPSGKASSA